MRQIYLYVTSSDVGGAQVFVRDLASFFIEKQSSVCIVSGPPKKGCSNFLSNLPVKSITIDSLSNCFSFWGVILAVITVCSILNRDRRAVHVANSGMAGTVVRLACVLTFSKCFFVVHGWSYAGWKKYPRRLVFFFVELFFEFFDWLFCSKIFVSFYDQKERPIRALNYFRRCRGKVIHNGAPKPKKSFVDSRFKRLELSLGGSIYKLHVLTVARLSKQKDIGCLLNAIALCPFATLTIVGDGECRDYLVSLARDLSISTRVKFLGEIDPSLMSNEYCKADVFVLASNWEGFPISTIEAMSFGWPVILSDVGGACEVFKYASDVSLGFPLLNENNPETLAEFLDRYLDPEVLRDHSYGSKYIYDTCFDSLQVCEAYEKHLFAK